MRDEMNGFMMTLLQDGFDVYVRYVRGPGANLTARNPIVIGLGIRDDIDRDCAASSCRRARSAMLFSS
jgi:hypothetical protein